MARSQGQSYPFPVFLVILILCMLAYTFLHEAGHAFVASLAGADVSDFTIFSFRPHVTYPDQTSGIFAPFVSLAGPLLPVFTAIFILLIFQKTNHAIAETFKTIFSSLTAFSLFGSIISLFLYSSGQNSDADTMGFFLQNPGVNPLLAALTCLFLIIILLVLIGKKVNYLAIPGLYYFLKSSGSSITYRKKKVILSLLVVFTMGLAGTFFLNFEKSQTLLRADISTFDDGETEIYRFDIKQDSIKFKYSIERLNAKEFDLIIRTDTSRTMLLSGRKIIADIYNREFVLYKGLHFLMVHNLNGNGILTLNQVTN